MSKKFDLTKEDLYGILCVSEDATEKQIVKAYRKQALKCHPDKNPDNPAAAEEFLRLTQALEVLTDAAAKAAYDKILKAKKAAQLRQKQYDSKRKKFKDDLEERERAAENQRQDEVSAAENLQAEIERLRKEGNRILKETQEQLQKDLEEKLVKQNEDKLLIDSEEEQETSAKIKAKWKIKKGGENSEGYTKDDLMKIFSAYGEVLNLVLSVKKSGTAIIEYTSPFIADLAMKSETGRSDCPLTLTWLSEPPVKKDQNVSQDRFVDDQKKSTNPSQFGSFQQYSPGQMTVDNKDYESLVLMKMRQAEERKRLIEQMEKEDEEGS